MLFAFDNDQTPDLSEIEDLLVENYFEAAIAGYKVAERNREKKESHRLARPMKMPRSFRDLMRMYDLWKQGKYTPRRTKEIAQKVKQEYLKKCRSVWDTYGEAFRTGEQASRVEAVKQVRKAAATTTSRAKTIVRTETTSAYNDARKTYYDKAQDVTHYLFLAIRDRRTTKWCSENVQNGKRGRHGLVYKKDDPLAEQERPACHWNCRSEFLPLTPVNPSHLKLIEDKSIARRNHQCHPLPPGWKG